MSDASVGNMELGGHHVARNAYDPRASQFSLKLVRAMHLPPAPSPAGARSADLPHPTHHPVAVPNLYDRVAADEKPRICNGLSLAIGVAFEHVGRCDVIVRVQEVDAVAWHALTPANARRITPTSGAISRKRTGLQGNDAPCEGRSQ
jgi:hypothetical protein